MNVLVIAPHPDDEVLGCGGTLCRQVEAGDRVEVVFLTSGELGLKQLPREEAWRIREAEAGKAARILRLARLHFLRGPDWMIQEQSGAIAKALRPILKEVVPELIYLPHPEEAHPDHKAAWPILRAALRDGPAPRAIRAYEVWTPLTKYDQMEDITPWMQRKLRALRAHRSQLADLDYAAAVTALNRYRGILAARCRYAEVFQSFAWPDRR
jgi:LmbE family N-acetylglucosaminyl deacetylase